MLFSFTFESDNHLESCAINFRITFGVTRLTLFLKTENMNPPDARISSLFPLNSFHVPKRA